MKSNHIFVSYNHSDKDVVEPISGLLRETYGKESVFFDSWSIRPGDGIIDKMSEGLEQCDVFLLFVSKNSLKSEMVKIEWQNALMRRAKKELRFVPVRLDDSVMPAILRQICYIDFNVVGFDEGCRQIIDVINECEGESAAKDYENCECEIAYSSSGAATLTFSVKHCLEPDPRFLISVDCDIEELEIDCLTDNERTEDKKNGFKFTDGTTRNILYEKPPRGITKGFPFTIKITSKSGKLIPLLGIWREYKAGSFKSIPVTILLRED